MAVGRDQSRWNCGAETRGRFAAGSHFGACGRACRSAGGTCRPIHSGVFAVRGKCGCVARLGQSRRTADNTRTGQCSSLHGAPGRAFDASVEGTKLVLVSSDDGICSVATDKATQQAVIEALETGLRQAALAFRLVIERDDAHQTEIHDHEYLAAKGRKGWRILAATVTDQSGGEAMLTASRE